MTMIVDLDRKLATCLLSLLSLGLPMSLAATEPFSLDDVDAVYSDAAWVSYLVDRGDLFTVTGKCKYDAAFPNDLSKTDDINGLPCFVASHRFCRTRGHLSGFGVENSDDPARVDITCVSEQIAEIQVVDFDHLESHRSQCPNATASAACGVAINYHCRGTHSPGFRFGFGPVERGTRADIVCVSEDITFDEGGRSLPECAGGSQSLVSTACRQAMDAMCRQEGDLRGGVTYLDRNVSAGLAHLACIRHVQDWVSNSPPEPNPPVLPDPPAFPVDVIASEIDPATGQTGVLPHNALASNRSLSHDGRIYLHFTGTELRFGVQKPELFTAPLTQDQPVNHSAGNGNVDVGLPANAFHLSTGGIWEGNSSAICDPHRGLEPLANVNRQQSVPSRKSNPYACDSTGRATSGVPGDMGDHDCYKLTIVTVYDTGLEDELWGAEVKVIVADPTTTSGVGSRTVSSIPRCTREPVSWVPLISPTRPPRCQTRWRTRRMSNRGSISTPTCSGTSRITGTCSAAPGPSRSPPAASRVGACGSMALTTGSSSWYPSNRPVANRT